MPPPPQSAWCGRSTARRPLSRPSSASCGGGPRTAAARVKPRSAPALDPRHFCDRSDAPRPASSQVRAAPQRPEDEPPAVPKPATGAGALRPRPPRQPDEQRGANAHPPSQLTKVCRAGPPCS